MLSNESFLYILLSSFHTQLWAFKARESLRGSHKMPIKINGQKLGAKSFILGKRGRQRELCISALFAETPSASQHTIGSSTRRRFRKLLSPGLCLIQNHFSEKIFMYDTSPPPPAKKEKKPKKILARKFYCLIYN